jgi:anthranilate synthase component 1
LKKIFTRTLVADGTTPVQAYARLRDASGGSASYLLESVVGGNRWARLSVLGYRPRYEYLLMSDGSWIARGDVPPGAKEFLEQKGDPMALAAQLFRASFDDDDADVPAWKMQLPHLVARLARAHVGYFSWDLVHAIDKVPRWEGPKTVLARFIGGATAVVYDNFAQTMTIVGESEADLERAEQDLASPAALRKVAIPDKTRLPTDVVETMGDAAFEGIVRRAQEYIAAGDAFQIVLARTFRVPRAGRDPFDAYRAMRVLNPSPYMYFLDFAPVEGTSATRTQILGASPETLARFEDGVVTVRPLAGTRPRGETAEQDLAREQELLADEKERAEHVMLIDLGRNDVGRVAQVGTVKLLRQMEIERYSHVMHIVSEVEGRVDTKAVTPLDVFRSTFPAGTLSGAPKLRAMQIIRELESRPRGIYGGAVGYFAQSGNFDFAIAIRTAICEDDYFTVTAGAGVVEGSSPAAEAAETRSKARSALASIEAAPQNVT